MERAEYTVMHAEEDDNDNDPPDLNETELDGSLVIGEIDKDSLTEIDNENPLNHRLLSAKEEKQLILRAQSGDVSAQNALVTHNQKLVAKIAYKFVTDGLEIDDLIQEGNLGILRAIEKFDLSTGNKFSTYATWWIKQFIRRYIDNHSLTIRIPVHMHDSMRTVNRGIQELSTELGRQPTTDEIVIWSRDNVASRPDQAAGLSRERVEEILFLNVNASTASLNGIVPETEDHDELGDFIPDSEPGTEEQALKLLLNDTRKELLSLLTDRERAVIAQRFGLEDGEEHTLGEIAQPLGITKERVRQIEAKAIKKLQSYLRGKGIRLEDIL